MLSERAIRKHVAIIHAYSLMSSLQRKIVNVLLYEAINDGARITHQDSMAVECRTSFSSVIKATNFNSNNTQYFKEEMDKLASLKIEWNLLKDKIPGGISFLNLRVLQGSPTFNKDGTFNFAFHKIMIDLTTQPSIYGTIDLNIQSQFESKYSHSLYENSTRLVNLQKNKVIQLDIYRKLMGVDKDKYHSVRELTRNVNKPSIEEVNDRANFVVKLEPVKVWRKIVGFEVLVESKKKSTQPSRCIDTFGKDDICKEIKQTFNNLSEPVKENILKSYSEEYILEKIAYTKRYAKKEVSGFYPIPYFISALKNDYKPNNQNQSQNQQPKPSDNVTQWQEKLDLLNFELTHWKRECDHAKATNNLSMISDTQKYITQCQEKLRRHLLEKPLPEREIV